MCHKLSSTQLARVECENFCILSQQHPQGPATHRCKILEVTFELSEQVSDSLLHVAVQSSLKRVTCRMLQSGHLGFCVLLYLVSFVYMCR